MKIAYIGIGSNIGDPLKNCIEAVERIDRLDNSKVNQVSNWYKTEPIGVEGQNWYINGVVRVSTEMKARDLLNNLLSIEKDMGRIRREKWEPREIDLDILLFDNSVIKEPDLKIPHQLMHTRRFVLAPLSELAPFMKHPVFDKTMVELLHEIPNDEQIIRPVEV